MAQAQMLSMEPLPYSQSTSNQTIGTTNYNYGSPWMQALGGVMAGVGTAAKFYGLKRGGPIRLSKGGLAEVVPIRSAKPKKIKRPQGLGEYAAA
jgi:hypothetical protein